MDQEQFRVITTLLQWVLYGIIFLVLFALLKFTFLSQLQWYVWFLGFILYVIGLFVWTAIKSRFDDNQS